MELLKLENVQFAYKDTPVIDDFNLSVEEGSFTTLLGSSGCGKTTVLKLISGFLNAQKGFIKINGEIQNGILPNKRKVGMVFQDYALFPHLTVAQNMMYGLNLKRTSKAQKLLNAETVRETARNLDIENLLNRFPSELSGGQQQRVALGRALVLQPKILLMDEPLSSLDTNLRLKVREELKEIQRRLKITTVYVTHDREEAFSLSDKIAVMDKGKIIQYDTPQNLYFSPCSRFAAEFSGAANFIQLEGKTFFVRPDWIEISGSEPQNSDSAVCSADDGEFTLPGKIVSLSFLGSRVEYKVETCAQIVTVDAHSICKRYDAGQAVSLKILKRLELN